MKFSLSHEEGIVVHISIPEHYAIEEAVKRLLEEDGEEESCKTIRLAIPKEIHFELAVKLLCGNSDGCQKRLKEYLQAYIKNPSTENVKPGETGLNQSKGEENEESVRQ